MFCPNCGNQVPDGAVFCDSCGAKLQAADAPSPAPQMTQAQAAPPPEAYAGGAHSGPTPHIELCPDGFYRWVYEYDMLRNPVILLTILKIFGIIFAVVFLLMAIPAALDGSLSDFADDIVPLLIFIVVFGIIIFISYLIVAAMNGWRYIVLFEMGPDGLRHIQQPKQFTKAQGLAWLTTLMGVATGNIGQVGGGLMVSTHNETDTTFSAVKSVKILRSAHTIKVNEALTHNQVYAEPEDFDFVCEYIISHIPATAKRS